MNRKKSKLGATANVKYAAAMAGMKVLPIPALIATINSLIGVLQERGFEIRDWDNKSRYLYRISMIGGKTYAMLPHCTDPPEPEVKEATNGRSN